MELNDYQEAALRTCMRSCYNVPYMLINLQGEVGELSSKVAKAIRKEQLDFRRHPRRQPDEDGEANVMRWGAGKREREEFDGAVLGELGDVLWQLSGLCHVLGCTLEDVAQHNLDKLASRQRRGVIDGEGDER